MQIPVSRSASRAQSRTISSARGVNAVAVLEINETSLTEAVSQAERHDGGKAIMVSAKARTPTAP